MSNGFIRNILSSPASYENLHIGFIPFLVLFSIGSILLLIQLHVIKKSKSRLDSTSNQPFRFIRLKGTVILVAICIIEKSLLAYGAAHSLESILNKPAFIPLYIPIGLKPNSPIDHTLVNRQTHTQYPATPIQIKHQQIAPNIIFITACTFRSDMVNKDVMPQTHEFSKESLYFKHHYSGGNTTRFGYFTLFYGVDGNYWFPFLKTKTPPVFFDVLKKLQFQIQVVAGSSMDWPEFRDTIFKSVPNEYINDHLAKFNSANRNTKSKSEFIRWLDTIDPTRPFFGFILLDAAHGRYYPDEFLKFSNQKQPVNYLTLNKNHRDALFADYKNTIYFTDSLIGEILQKLKSMPQYKNTIVVITGDHGEEFFESGRFGHNNSFSEQQTRTPLILKLPGSKPKMVQKRTCHTDIMATVLPLLGVQNPIDEYSMGRNLLSVESDSSNHCVVGSWNHSAVVTDSRKFVFFNAPPKDTAPEIRDTQTYQLVGEDLSRDDTRFLQKVFDQNRRFTLKKHF